MTLRTRIAAAFSALSVLVVAGTVHAQFSPPTCVPPNCNPEVIQNILITGTAQSASINITGSQKLGGTFQTGALAPVLTLATDNLMYGNVGGTSTNGSLLLLQFGSADRLRVSLTGQLQLPVGSAAAPSYTFLGDTNTGFYSTGADSIGMATNGVVRTTTNNNGMTLNSGVMSLPAGTNAAPSLTFTGDTNTGIFRGTADTLSFVTNGQTGLTISSTNNVVIPNSLTVNGTFTSSGGLSGNGSGITNLNASNITTGTLADARLSTNVPLLNGTQTFTGANTFSNAGNSFTGNGAGLTSLNATNISSGTLADGRLSSNVALYNANGTFTGNNGFTGMTSLGSATLVTGAGQNLLYGVHDTTSTGNLVLLQTENAGVYTDRFRVDSDGDVTATSFTGVGTGLTALNATNLTSGTVPSARISGTYSNALTFSNRTTFGAATLNVAAGQNLIYGNVDTASAGNLLLLQNESVDRFRVDAAGNVFAAGTITATGNLTSNGQNVCLADGTNCPPTVDGTGTTNYVSKFTGPNTLGDSAIYDDGGGNIGIGTASPSAKLTVNGSISGTSVSTYMVAAGAAGVTGQVVGVGSYGVVGSGGSYGVYGTAGSYGVYGNNSSAGASGAGVYGYHNGTGPGVQGSSLGGWGGSFSSLYVTPGTAYFSSGATIGPGSALNLGTAAADPGGTNGAIYYNTTSNTFRCYASGAWGPCSTGISGTGTTNYIPKFTAASTIGNSTIQEVGTAITTTSSIDSSRHMALGSGLNATVSTGEILKLGEDISGALTGNTQLSGLVSSIGSTASPGAFQATLVGTWSGVEHSAGAGGALQNAYGVYGRASQASGQNIVNAYGVYGQIYKPGAGTITNGYAGYFQGVTTAANNWALYTATGRAQIDDDTTANVPNYASGVGELFVVGDIEADGGLDVDANTLYVDATNNRVGLGLATPANRLDVSGAAAIGSTYAGSVAPANGLVVQGSLGVGTQAPGFNFDLVDNIFGGTSAIGRIYAPTAGVANEASLYLVRADQPNGTASLTYTTYTSWPSPSWQVGLRPGNANYHVYDYAASRDRMTVTTAGNVGINNDAPTAKLDIGSVGVGTNDLIYMNADGLTGAGSSVVYADIWADNTDWDGYVFQFRDDTDHTTTKTLGWRGIDIKRQPTVSAGTLTIPVNATMLYLEDDCVELGGTCNNATDIAELVQYHSTASGTVLNIANGGVGNGLRVTDVGSFLDTTAFVVNSSGYVGVMDETPAYPLDVGGSAQVNGDIWMGTDSQVRLYRGSVCCGSTRLSVRASGVDGVAEFASYGLYLPKTGTSLYIGQTMYMGYAAALSTTGSGWICLTGGTSGTVAACGSSSIRYKNNVRDLTLGLDAVNKLRAVTYTWKENGKKGFGFIAEEVEKVDPLLVYYNNDGQIEGVHYPYMAALMAKAVQELDVKVEGNELKIDARLDAHEERIERLEDQIESLKSKLDALEDR